MATTTRTTKRGQRQRTSRLSRGVDEHTTLWCTAWGVVTAIFAGLGGLVWQSAAATGSTTPMWPAYVLGGVSAVGLYFVFAPLCHVWPFGKDRQRLRSLWRRVRRPQPVMPAPVTMPKRAEWEALHPLIVNGQLRATLRHASNREGSETHLWSCEVEIEGPDGRFQLTDKGPSSGYFNGVYVVHYPRDFGARNLSPGRYMIRWFGRGPTGRMSDDGKLELSDPLLIAESAIRVTAERRVEKC